MHPIGGDVDSGYQYEITLEQARMR